MKTIFVFESNLAGCHEYGNASVARAEHGAECGVSFGMTGNAYAIPVKDEKLKLLKLDQIALYVEAFIRFAQANPELEFYVNKIGFGLNAYGRHTMRKLFLTSLPNIKFDKEWGL